MDVSKIVIRRMREDEKKEIVKVKKKAFQFFEGIFPGLPKNAMVAEYEGEIVGSIIYSCIELKHTNMAYISEAFTDPEYHGLGIGKKLYADTFQWLWAQGVQGITALVKDDNIGSSKLLMKSGLKRVSFLEVAKQTGIKSLFKHWTSTPALFTGGMDFYMVTRNKEVKGKTNKSIIPIALFFIGNLLLLTPLWIRIYMSNPVNLNAVILAYCTILLFFILPRVIGGLGSKEKFHFRFNNCGGLTTFILSFIGVAFPMNVNWYPETYRIDRGFQRKMAFPEMMKWVIFLGLTFFAWTTNPYLKEVSHFAKYYLVLMILPFYPIEWMGGGRIYRNSKTLWLILLIVTVIQVFLVL